MNPEDLLAETLRERTERTDYPSTRVSSVAARAGRIRARRRRTTVLAAAAAVAAIAVPGAVWLGRSPESSPQPSHELSSGPTSSTTQQPTQPPTVQLGSLSTGAKPGIDYLMGDTYVAMGGGSTTSPAFAHAVSAALGRGGILVASPRAGSQLSDVSLVAGQQAQALGCGSSRFAITADRVESAYWLADSCVDPSGGGKLYAGPNNTMGGSGPGGTGLPNSGPVVPIGFVEQGLVVNARPTSGPEVLVVGTGPAIATLSVAGGADENNDVVSGQLASDPAVGAVVSAANQRSLWQKPGWVLGQFSTDGRYVLGHHPGDGSDQYAIFDASKGTEVATLGATGHLDQVAWDQQDSVLAVVTDGAHQAIVRFDLRGRPTLATPIRHVTASELGYRLATRP
jgi:hypothetical protein